MAMTVDSSSNLSPRGGGDSPQSRRKNLSSSWAQVVRVEPESSVAANFAPSPSDSSSSPFNSVTEKNLSLASDSSPKAVQLTPDNQAAAESSDSNGDNAGGRSKKQAWKKPSNGVLEVSPLGAISSWPALSESARTPSKSAAESSSKTTPDGSASTSQGPVNPQQSAQRQAPTNSNSSSVTNRTVSGTSSRQRNSRRGGNNGGNSLGGMPIQSGFTQPPPTSPPPPPFPGVPMHPSFISVISDSTIQGLQFRPNGGFISQPRMVNDHRPFSRRGNNGRGGHFNQNGSGRRDHDRGSYDNVHIQSQGVQPRVPVRPPPPNASNFVPSFRPPFYPDFLYVPTPYGVFPYSAPPPPILMRPPEVSLAAQLVRQIDYYFSDANLVGDTFLKDNMDDQGWVPISVIASFRRVNNLTNDINLILDWLKKGSTIVEVEGDKVRRRDGWMKWVSSGQVSSDSGSLSQAGSSAENLAASLDRITMEEKDSDPHSNDS